MFRQRFLIAGVTGILATAPAVAQGTSASINTGDTAWLLVSCALVMLMTPGLALFYGGMVRQKNVLSTICTASPCWQWLPCTGR